MDTFPEQLADEHACVRIRVVCISAGAGPLVCSELGMLIRQDDTYGSSVRVSHGYLPSYGCRASHGACESAVPGTLPFHRRVPIWPGLYVHPSFRHDKINLLNRYGRRW